MNGKSSRWTRRRFLKATAAAAPLVVSAGALGLADKPAASERIAMAQIGSGPGRCASPGTCEWTSDNSLGISQFPQTTLH